MVSEVMIKIFHQDRLLSNRTINKEASNVYNYIFKHIFEVTFILYTKLEQKLMIDAIEKVFNVEKEFDVGLDKNLFSNFL